MGLWDSLRAFVQDGPTPTAPLDPDAVRDWYASLPEDLRARWSERFRAEFTTPISQRRRAIGRLLFFRDGARGPVPLHHARVELWDRDPCSAGDFLGATRSDADGRFSVAYDPRDAGPGDIPDLELRVLEPQHAWDREGRAVDRYSTVFTLAGPDDVEAELYDFGDVRVPYWEYDPHGAIPRLHVPVQGAPQEPFAPGRALAMFRAVDPVELNHRKHLARIALGTPPTIDSIQADYPPCATTRAEAAEPGVTREGRWLGERILNGFFSTVLDGDWDPPDDPAAFRVYHPWNAYAQDGAHNLPTVDLRLRLVDGALLPTRVTLGFRARGATAPMSPLTRVDVTPADGPRWRAALRFVRVSATYDAELSNHLGQCHLNVEQYAVAARRNLRESPLRWLLHPHLREVVAVNHAADGFLLGPDGYVTRAGGLSPEGVSARLLHAMGGFDWAGFAPQRPLCPGHRSARAGAVLWELLGAHVDAFLDEHREGIAAHWLELRRMSDDLVAHAVPRYACAFVQARVRGSAAPFFSRGERTDYDAPPGPAVSPVTTSDVPAAEDWPRLAQLCRYVIFFATFRHAWANNLQWDDAGEVRYTNLALRWADGDPLDLPEEATLPEALDATDMLWISWLLSKTSYGTVTANEDNDVHPRLVRLLRARREELAALGLDIDRIGARINI